VTETKAQDLTGQVFRCIVAPDDCDYNNKPWIGIFSGPGDPSARSMEVDEGDRFEIIGYQHGNWYLCKALNAGKLFHPYAETHLMDPDDFVFTLSLDFHVSGRGWFEKEAA
jgi:hypothetical protein